jgi:quercetin dioxygenase-like cupin family protein
MDAADPCASGCESCAKQMVVAGEQPFGVEVHVADNVFVKQMVIPKAGTYVPQHAHRYDHLSMLAVGSVKAWADDALLGEFHAPHGFNIPANVKHTFLALEDQTIIYCIHNAARSDFAAVLDEHQLVRVA